MARWSRTSCASSACSWCPSPEMLHSQKNSGQVSITRLREQEAEAHGIIVEQRSVSCAELQDTLLLGQHIVVALVDKNLLNRGIVGWQQHELQPSDLDYRGMYTQLKYNCLVRKPVL